MNISADLLSSTISPPAAAPARPEGEVASPVQRVAAVEQMSNSLSDDDRGNLLSAAKTLQDSGANFSDVKAFVDSELASYGVDVPSGGDRAGQMVDMYA